VDPLSDVLSLVKPRAYVTGGLAGGDPWSIRLPAYDGIKCYAVAAGVCWVEVDGVDEPVQLRPGSCVLLPHGRPFVLTSDLAIPPVDARTLLLAVEKRHDGVLALSPGNNFFVLGSHFALEGDARFLLDVLPPIVVPEDSAQRESTRWAIERMVREMRDFQPGGTLVAQQVAYMLLVEALRLHVASNAPRGSGWLFALADARMERALTCIHQSPGQPWTVEELARSAGMSRTAFAQVFKRTVGETPMSYLTRWRMTVAANRLQDERASIASVAPSLGYQSESAFSAAFKRQWGSSPRDYVRGRRAAHNGTAGVE
jgi:AraC-like DNA-binding protein